MKTILFVLTAAACGPLLAAAAPSLAAEVSPTAEAGPAAEARSSPEASLAPEANSSRETSSANGVAESGDAQAKRQQQQQTQSADDVVGLEDIIKDAGVPSDESGHPTARRRPDQQRGTRFTVKQEVSSGISAPSDVANERTSFRLEYQKYFLDHFYLNLDATEIKFWSADHRAKSGTSDESLIRNAYLQFSGGNTSVKFGRQLVIWGESEAGVITDVISPRDFRELFFISLEESRLSQLMLTVDQFSRFGDWSVFYVPTAQLNKYPTPGDRYYVNYFPGFTQTTTVGGNLQEFGMRWKKTFGNSDISLMAASLIDGVYADRQQGTAADGTPLIDQYAQRFNMVGLTFNRVAASFLFSAEVAKKSSLPYLDATTLQTVHKDDLETSLKLQHSLGNGGDHSIGLEIVNRHVMGWSTAISPISRDTNNLVLSWSNSFLEQNLNATLLTVYNATHTGVQNSLFLDYKLNSHIGLSLNAFYLSARDRNNEFSPYDGVTRVVARMLYQFQ